MHIDVFAHQFVHSSIKRSLNSFSMEWTKKAKFLCGLFGGVEVENEKIIDIPFRFGGIVIHEIENKPLICFLLIKSQNTSRSLVAWTSDESKWLKEENTPDIVKRTGKKFNKSLSHVSHSHHQRFCKFLDPDLAKLTAWDVMKLCSVILSSRNSLK